MTRRDSFFSVANLLSLSRVPLGILFAGALVAPWGGPWRAMGVLAMAGLTDALDGHFARREHARRLGNPRAETPGGTGSWLDPICDKIFVATVLLAIWYQSRPPILVLGLILARELAQLPLSAIYVAVPTLRQWLRYDFRASHLGKAATVSQFAAITALIFKSRATPWAAGLACAIGCLALADYVRRAVRIGRLRQREDASGFGVRHEAPVRAPVGRPPVSRL
jgi:phosphatidylglycerophosphate synthase